MNRLLAVILAVLGPALSVWCDVLLEIDVSNPSAVIFRATGGRPAVNKSGFDFFDGFTLLAFLTQPATEDPTVLSTSLSDHCGITFYDRFDVNDFEGSGDVDLNVFYRTLGGGNQDFVTDSVAFTGELTGNFAGLSGLPPPGSTGNVALGYEDNKGPVIGTYQVVGVPEPSCGLLALLALSAAALGRRSPRRQA